MIASKFGLEENGTGGGAVSERPLGGGLPEGTGGGFAVLLNPSSNAGLKFGGGSLLGFSSWSLSALFTFDPGRDGSCGREGSCGAGDREGTCGGDVRVGSCGGNARGLKASALDLMIFLMELFCFGSSAALAGRGGRVVGSYAGARTV